jgi:hypothetical protein
MAGSANKQRRMIAPGHGRDELVVVWDQVGHRACLLMHTGPRTTMDHVHGECHIHYGAAESNASGEHSLLPNGGGQLLFRDWDADLIRVGHLPRRCHVVGHQYPTRVSSPEYPARHLPRIGMARLRLR